MSPEVNPTLAQPAAESSSDEVMEPVASTQTPPAEASPAAGPTDQPQLIGTIEGTGAASTTFSVRDRALPDAQESVVEKNTTAVVTKPEQLPKPTASVPQNQTTGTPMHVILLLIGALAACGFFLHAAFTAIAARRRRVRVEPLAEEPVEHMTPARLPWMPESAAPAELSRAPVRHTDPHEDIDETLRKILQACGHRAA